MGFPKNEDVFLADLAIKFRKAGYKLTNDSVSNKKKEKDNSPFTITPINSDNIWCFNACNSDRY